MWGIQDGSRGTLQSEGWWVKTGENSPTIPPHTNESEIKRGSTSDLRPTEACRKQRFGFKPESRVNDYRLHIDSPRLDFTCWVCRGLCPVSYG